MATAVAAGEETMFMGKPVESGKGSGPPGRSPGPGRPDRASDFGLSRDALLKASVPVLGVCLGFQGLAMASGGRLAYAPSLVHGEASLVRHDDDPLFAGVPSPFTAGRYHSFMIERPLPAPRLGYSRL